ncbi:hypothetical protein F2Q68_00038247 [Brassica cretica]|uniref:FAE domain-containing protein n=1 Tax=Brassica cretica TaxID=69181 RepID=A0A8S9MMP3_BRACR|nr:hypothetical protein F2Q68_00038247 [Brassica cretica]
MKENHIQISNSVYILLAATSLLNLSNQTLLYNHLLSSTLFAAALIFLTTYFTIRPRKIFLLDFACYKPDPSLICSRETFMDRSQSVGIFSKDNLAFQQNILERSGLGQNTYVPEALLRVPPNPSMSEARKEAETVMFGAIDAVLEKTGVKPKEIGILVVNCSLFNPTPSLSAMIVNKYKLRENILTYNLGGMGCSAGLISIDLVKQLLQETTDQCFSQTAFSEWAAPPFSSPTAPPTAASQSINYSTLSVPTKELTTTPSTALTIAKKNNNNNKIGVSLSKDLMKIAGKALKTNIATLGPLLLPMSEQLLTFARLAARKVFKVNRIKPYVYDTKLAFRVADGAIEDDFEPVWEHFEALRSFDPSKEKKTNPWIDEIHEFPVQVPRISSSR